MVSPILNLFPEAHSLYISVSFARGTTQPVLSPTSNSEQRTHRNDSTRHNIVVTARRKRVPDDILNLEAIDHVIEDILSCVLVCKEGLRFGNGILINNYNLYK